MPSNTKILLASGMVAVNLAFYMALGSTFFEYGQYVTLGNIGFLASAFQ